MILKSWFCHFKIWVWRTWFLFSPRYCQELENGSVFQITKKRSNHWPEIIVASTCFLFSELILSITLICRTCWSGWWCHRWTEAFVVASSLRWWPLSPTDWVFWRSRRQWIMFYTFEGKLINQYMRKPVCKAFSSNFLIITFNSTFWWWQKFCNCPAMVVIAVLGSYLRRRWGNNDFPWFS